MKRIFFAVVLALALTSFGVTDTRAASPAPPAVTVADFHGIGPLRFGMTTAQMRKAWRMPLQSGPQLGDPTSSACYYLTPRNGSNDLMFMVEAGRFVRVDVAMSDVSAPGGGRVGMSMDEVRRMYAGRIKATPNFYDAAATDLRVAPLDGEKTLLLFEVNAVGKVTSWRVGEMHQVNYVEGCS